MARESQCTYGEWCEGEDEVGLVTHPPTSLEIPEGEAGWTQTHLAF